MADLPVIQDHPPHYPLDRMCPICGERIRERLVYLSGGATADEKVDKSELRGFMAVGIHAADHRESKNLDVVVNSYGGQFDLGFCSVDCLDKFLQSLVERLRS